MRENPVNDDETLAWLGSSSAAHSQLQAAANDLAAVIAAYFNTLLLNGLERQEALILTSDYQHMLLHTIMPAPAADEKD